MSRSAVALLVLLFSISAFSNAHAGDLDDRGANAYHDLLSAQQALLQSELDKDRTRLGSLEQLRAGGHASWLEVRRQRLKTQTMEVRVGLLKHLAATVKWNARSKPEESIFDGMTDPLGKLLFTDLKLKTDSAGEGIDLGLLQRFLVEREQSMIQTQTNPTEAEMNLIAAHRALANSLQNWMQHNHESVGHDAGVGNHQISDELLAASVKQCDVHNQLIELALSREQGRLEKVNELFAQNMTSGKDIQILQGRIDQLLRMQQEQTQVMVYLQQQESVSDVDEGSSVARSLAQEVRFQFELHEAHFQQESSRLEQEMLQEVLSRLEVAAAKAGGPTYSGIGHSLSIGQQNEINSYRQKIRMMELESQFAHCRIEVLKAQGESGRFLQVSLADEPETSPNFALGLSSASLINMLTVPGSARKALPSALFDRSFEPFPFDFRSHKGDFRSVSLTRRTPVSFSRSLTPKFSSRLSKTPSSFYQSRVGASRSSFGSFSTGKSVHKPLPTLGRAYRNGIIRSDLRPFLRVGQIPWYLPGSPTNLRTQQLRTDYRSNSFGISGNQLLHSTRFTDLHGR